MLQRNAPPDERAALSRSEQVDLALYRESAWFRIRFAIWRSVGLLGLIYVANVLVNAIESVIKSGLQVSLQSSKVADTLLLPELADVGRQVPSLALSLLGVVLLGTFLTVTARLRY